MAAGTDTRLTVTGMSCSGCARKVQAALLAVPGVDAAEVDHAAGQARIHHRGAEVTALLAAVEQAGYHATPDAGSATPVTARVPVAVHQAIPAAAHADLLQLHIEGAKCASCVLAIENALRSVPGVTQASMNLADRSAQVHGHATAEALVAAVQSAGYGASLAVDDDSDSRDALEHRQYLRHLRDMALALGLGVPMMLWGMTGDHMMVEPGGPSQRTWMMAGLLTLAVMVFAGGHFFRNAWKALRYRQASMDTLIALGTGSAWLYSMAVVLWPETLPHAARHVYFEASAMIIGLINLGLALESRARGKTGAAIRRLLDLRPKTARVIRDGEETDVPVGQVQVGDRLRVRPGETIAVDGTVEEGSSHVDESMLTGEAMPVHKQAGDPLAAGTLNKGGTLLYRATRIGRDTALARIIALVKQAQGSKPPIGRLADQVASVFVPVVILVAIAAAVVWYLVGPEPRLVHMLVAATTVLIIACPCALGLATPMSVMVGVGKAAEAGILIRHGDALQVASALDTVVLDKTGTITEGRPSVTRIMTVPGISEREALQVAASLERGSEHPLAAAIVEAARQRGLSLAMAESFEALAGLGVRGRVDGQTVRLGHARWLDSEGLATAALQPMAAAITQEAGTPLFLAIGQQVVAVIGVADRIREDSRAAIARLQQRGLHVVMLTGDNRATAEAMARLAGVDEVLAEVLPEHKADRIRELKARGRKVAMVGDGINDAPALAEADVGFAIGTGTDVAIESASITLMRSSLHGVADAMDISAATLRNIRQNLFGAFVYNILGIPIAAGVLYPFFGILLNPVIAGAAMSLSSVTVVSNANRLRWFRPGAR